MNNDRRKAIDKAAELLFQARLILEAALDGEGGYLDAMPESFRNGEKGGRSSAAVDALESAVCCIEEAEEFCAAAGARGEG